MELFSDTGATILVLLSIGFGFYSLCKVIIYGDKIKYIQNELSRLRRELEAMHRQREEAATEASPEAETAPHVAGVHDTVKGETAGDDVPPPPPVMEPGQFYPNPPYGYPQYQQPWGQPQQPWYPNGPAYPNEMPRVSVDLPFNSGRPRQKKDKVNYANKIEKFIGQNLFSIIGIFVLVIGIGFFVKYAIDRNWIDEVIRTILGLMTGFGLWGIAYRLRKRYRKFSSVLAGGGFAMCYVTIAVAYNYYRLLSGPLTMGVFVILSAIMVVMSLNWRRRELAAIAVFGGYIAPFLSAGENASILMLFSYTTLLSLALFVISLRRKWMELIVIETFVTWVIVGYVLPTSGTSVRDSVALVGFSTLLYTLFAMPLATVMARGMKRSVMYGFLLMAAVVNPIAYTVYALLGMHKLPDMNDYDGLVPLYVSVVNLVMYICFYHRKGARPISAMVLCMAIVFGAVSIPVQFTTLSTISMSFAIYALILTVAYVCTGQNMFIVLMPIVVFANIMCRIFAGTHLIPDSVSALAYFAMTIIVSRKWSVFGKFSKYIPYSLYGIFLNVACAFATFALVNGIATAGMPNTLEDYVQSCVISALVLGVAIFGRQGVYTTVAMPLLGVGVFEILTKYGLTFGSTEGMLTWSSALLLLVAIVIFARRTLLTNGGNIYKAYAVYFSGICTIFLMSLLDTATTCVGLDVTYSAIASISLTIAGAILMLLGLRCHLRAIRVASLVLFGILLVKLGCYDLWLLPTVARIVVFVLLGAVLLCLSFLFQRLKDTVLSQDRVSAATDQESVADGDSMS